MRRTSVTIFCWMTDSPMIRSNVWVVMALVSQQTQRLRSGTGEAVPGLRLAPVASNGIASINRITHLVDASSVWGPVTQRCGCSGIPCKVAILIIYRVVGAFLRGEEVDFTLDGVMHPITFANTDFGYINLEERIPIPVGGFGPRAGTCRRIGRRTYDGFAVGRYDLRSLANVRRGERAGRSLGDFKVYALVNLLLLEPAETLDSERVIREIGSGIMVNVHYLVERWKETGGTRRTR